MGFIRGGLFVVASVLLFTGLLVANTLFVMQSSLEYENIHNALVPIVKETLQNEVNINSVLEENLPYIQLYCENNSEFVFNNEGQTFVLSCDSILEGPDAILDESIDSFIADVYYKDYSCGFIDCFKEESLPFFIVSENTKNYLKAKFYLLLPFLFILLIAMFLLVEKKTNFPLVVGSLFIVSSLPFLKLESLFSFFADKTFLKFITFIFAKSYSVFITIFLLGLLFLIIGIVLKFFVVGFSISNFLEKFKGKQAPAPQTNKTSK